MGKLFPSCLLPERIPEDQLLRPAPDVQAPQPPQSTRLQTSSWDQCLCVSQPTGCHSIVETTRRARTPAMKRLQESRRVEISPYGLTRGVEINLHSYSPRIFVGDCHREITVSFVC